MRAGRPFDGTFVRVEVFSWKIVRFPSFLQSPLKDESYFCPVPSQIRSELEQHMSCNLKEYKEFIDNEMLLILGQMDKATLIFDHVYLVRVLLG